MVTKEVLGTEPPGDRISAPAEFFFVLTFTNLRSLCSNYVLCYKEDGARNHKFLKAAMDEVS